MKSWRRSVDFRTTPRLTMRSMCSSCSRRLSAVRLRSRPPRAFHMRRLVVIWPSGYSNLDESRPRRLDETPDENECGGTRAVVTKAQMIEAIQALPDDATVEDAMDRLYVL